MSVKRTRGSLPPRIKLPPPERLRRTSGFDFTSHMRRLCEDFAVRLPQLSHVDMRRVAVSYSQARKNVAHGLQASLTPLRFENGALTTHRRRGLYTVQRVFDSCGSEMLYILNFYLPRFLNHALEEKLTTVVHELWHISPAFDGDLRRHDGRCYIHSGSQKEYDAEMARYAAQWLKTRPHRELYEFLELDFRGLKTRHGAVFGVRMPAPKLIPAREAAE